MVGVPGGRSRGTAIASDTANQSRLEIRAFWHNGVRLSEFRGIRIRDVDLTQRRIRMLGKGDKERLVVFPQRVPSANSSPSKNRRASGRAAPSRCRRP